MNMIKNIFWITVFPEAVLQRSSMKKVFLETSQNSQENPCAKVSFLINKVAGLRLTSEFKESRLFAWLKQSSG